MPVVALMVSASWRLAGHGEGEAMSVRVGWPAVRRLDRSPREASTRFSERGFAPRGFRHPRSRRPSGPSRCLVRKGLRTHRRGRGRARNLPACLGPRRHRGARSRALLPGEISLTPGGAVGPSPAPRRCRAAHDRDGTPITGEARPGFEEVGGQFARARGFAHRWAVRRPDLVVAAPRTACAPGTGRGRLGATRLPPSPNGAPALAAIARRRATPRPRD